MINWYFALMSVGDKRLTTVIRDLHLPPLHALKQTQLGFYKNVTGFYLGIVSLFIFAISCSESEI